MKNKGKPRSSKSDQPRPLQRVDERKPAPADADELVDENIDESFPASDPPSFTPSRAGPPAKKPDRPSKTDT